jgi:hypothetical protein
MQQQASSRVMQYSAAAEAPRPQHQQQQQEVMMQPAVPCSQGKLQGRARLQVTRRQLVCGQQS